MKTNFNPYKVGTVFNPIKTRFSGIKPVYKSVKIRFPSRLNAMAIDPSKIASNRNLIYTPGEVVFSIGIYKLVKVGVLNNKGNLEISQRSKRKSLIKHAYILMKKALNFKERLYIDIDNEQEVRHCGFGSSSGLIASIACAINEIYGSPIDGATLVRYLAQNHGEEIEGSDDLINPVQCIGGSATAGIFKGGLLVIAGDSCLIKTMDVPSQYKVVIGIPKNFKEHNSKVLLNKEIKNLNKFIRTGKKFGPQIAYNIFHRLLPAMAKGDLATVGDIIFDYRFNMGSIKNCSFVYPEMIDLTKKLAFLKKKGVVEVLSISSVGPAIFAITKDLNYCSKAFKKLELRVIVTKIQNSKYKVSRKKFNV